LRNGYTKQRLDIGIGIVRSSLSSDSSAREFRGWVIDPLGRMRLLGTAAGRGDTGCGSGPERVDLVVFSQRRDFRSPRGLESGVQMYRSTGCRWAHGWIFLASPLSSILLSLYCFSYSTTFARCILYLILLHNPYKRRLQHRSCELRGSKSRILQFTTLRLSKPCHPSNRLRLPTLPLLRDRLPSLANRSIHLEPPSNALSIHKQNRHFQRCYQHSADLPKQRASFFPTPLFRSFTST